MSSEQKRISITFNGQAVEVRANTLAALLGEMGIAGERIALERNREIVPRRQWADTVVAAGDQIEVVQFVGGGGSSD